MIMVGRAARGNPWLFGRLDAWWKGEKPQEKPDGKQIREMILRHARLQIEYKGVYTGMREMRKHVAWYTAGLPHSSGMRRAANQLETYEQLEELTLVLLDKG